MFRGCYFEYAGVFSGDYNLVTAYLDNNYTEFDSGGVYKPNTEALPRVAESLLYSLNYSENPLEFELEIFNPDEAIPQEKMREIKNWLFGQDGWKKLKIKDSNFQDYYLMCLLIPESDILDVSGYRGLRCKVMNISPFWYGDEKIINISESDLESGLNENFEYVFNINVDTDNPLATTAIFTFTNPDDMTKNRLFEIKNNTNNSMIYMSTTTGDFWKSGATYEFNTKYLYFKSNEAIANYTPALGDGYEATNKDIFYLSRGNNEISILCCTTSNPHEKMIYKNFSIAYTPCYRVGGF